MTVDLRATIQLADIDYKGVPMAFWPKRTLVMLPDGRKIAGPIRDTVSAVCRSMADCNDLVAAFGGRANFCPDLPILVLLPGGVPELVAGLGFATVAELRDCCCELWGVKTGSDAWKRYETGEMRERMGLARKEDVPEMVREAFWERNKRHQASPVTDPWKQFKYPNPTHKVSFPEMPDNKSWSETNDEG